MYDGGLATDDFGYQYRVHCATDSQGSSWLDYPPNGGGIEACFEKCDGYANCTGFSYTEDSTQTYGTCHLKSNMGTLTAAASNVLVAIQQQPSGYAYSSAAAASSSAAASSVSARSTSTAAASSTRAASAGTPSPTACTFSNNDYDDGFCQVNLPFNMVMYGKSSSTTFASINGVSTLLQVFWLER